MYFLLMVTWIQVGCYMQALYYMAYALTSASFAGAEKLLEVTIVTIFISMLVHGLSARTIQLKIKKLHEAEQ